MSLTPVASPATRPDLEMRRSRLGPLLEAMAGRARLRDRALRLAFRLEGGQYFSLTARSILARHCGIVIGDYSYGSCFDPTLFPPGVTVGRYASIARGVSVFRRNHPLERPSLHPAFYNPSLGLVDADRLPTEPLLIADETWIGAHAVVTPGCRRIGVGAVVAAGAVVTKDVPDFAIVAGNPAAIIRFRFAEPVRASILADRWWERPLAENAGRLGFFLEPLVHPTPPQGES